MMDEDLRRHSLPLEDVQRIHLGADVGLFGADQMDFSADTIAAMLQDVADRVSVANAVVIHAVARALRGEDQHHRLELRQVRRGKHKMAHDRAAERGRNQQWLERLAELEREGMKTEAAIAAIAEEWGVRRASVFAGIRAAETTLQLFRSADRFAGHTSNQFDNPRPNKDGKS